MSRNAIRKLLGTTVATLYLMGCFGCSADDAESEPWDVSSSCGDEIAIDGEACDGSDLLGRTCADFGYPAGELRCNDTCTGVLVEHCQGVPDWSHTGRSECFECGPDEVCVYGECVAPCDGESLDGARLDLDISTVEVSGQLGLPQSSDPGSIVFENLQTNAATHINVTASVSADGTFEAEIYAGTYDIYWTNVRAYGNRGPGVRLASEVAIDSERVLDLDLPELVMLEIDLEPSDDFGEFGARVIIERLDERGEEMSFSAKESLTARVDVAPEDTPQLSMLVAHGTYRARLERSAATLDDRTLPMLIFESRRIDAPTFLDVPVDLHTVTGTVSLPDQLSHDIQSASVNIAHADSSITAELPPSRVARNGQFAATLLSGTYDFTASIDGLYEIAEMDTLSVEVDSDVHLDFVTGQNFVAVSGHLQQTAERLVSLTFFDVHNRHRRLTTRPTDGSFDISLPPGRYHIRATSPSGSAYLGELEVAEDPIEDLVLEMPEPRPTVSIRGQVTVNGAVMPDNTLADEVRGTLRFVCTLTAECGETAVVEVGSSGPASFEVELAPGVYHVEFLFGLIGTQRPSTSNAVAPGRYVLDPHFSASSLATRRDFDVKQAHITANITAAGDPLPSDEAFGDELDGERGPLQSMRVADFYRSTTTTSVALPADEATDLQFDLLPGLYSLHVPLPGFSEPHGLRRRIEVSGDVDLQWDLPLHRAEVQLTHNGDSWGDEHNGAIEVHTQLGVFESPVGPDGTVTIWWLGEDPSIHFLALEGALPHDSMLLRQGCL